MILDTPIQGTKLPPLSREQLNSKAASRREFALVRALFVLLFSVLFVGGAGERLSHGFTLAFQPDESSESELPRVAQESEGESAECSPDDSWEDDVEESGGVAAFIQVVSRVVLSDIRLVSCPEALFFAPRLMFSLQSRAPPVA